MAAPLSIENITEAAMVVGITAQLTAHSVTVPTFRSEFKDDDASPAFEAKDMPCIVTKPMVAVPMGYKMPEQSVAMMVQCITYAPQDLKNATRHNLFQSIIHTLKNRDFATDFTSEGNGGTFGACMVTGGSFRLEDQFSIAEIECTFKVCT